MIHTLDAVVMILRVWALYDRSMLVLGTLLTIYTMEEVTMFISYVIITARLGSSESKPK